MTICKICNSFYSITCICGYCMNCIRSLGHSTCIKIDNEHREIKLQKEKAPEEKR